MECIHTENSKRLTKIFKVFFPSLIIISIIIFQFYRYSIDTIEIYVVSKDSEWIEHCTEDACVEYLQFTIEGKTESFTTNEASFVVKDSVLPSMVNCRYSTHASSVQCSIHSESFETT